MKITAESMFVNSGPYLAGSALRNSTIGCSQISTTTTSAKSQRFSVPKLLKISQILIHTNTNKNLHHLHQSSCNNQDVQESRNAALRHQLALSRNQDPSQTVGKSTPARSTIIMKIYYIFLPDTKNHILEVSKISLHWQNDDPMKTKNFTFKIV